MLINHPKVHEQMGLQHVQLKVATFDVERRGIAHPFQDRICQRTGTKLFRRHQLLRHTRGCVRQGHQPRARALVQGFDQRLNFVFEHAGHQPFAAFFIDLVQRKDWQLDRHAISRIARLVQVGSQAIYPAESQGFGKCLGGDAGGLMAHQLVLAQAQQIRLALDLGFVPALAARAGANVGWQLLVVKRVDQLFVNQHILTPRLVLQVLDMGNHFFIGHQKRQLGVPISGYQSFANEDLTRHAWVDPAEVDTPPVVHHYAVQRGPL